MQSTVKFDHQYEKWDIKIYWIKNRKWNLLNPMWFEIDLDFQLYIIVQVDTRTILPKYFQFHWYIFKILLNSNKFPPHNCFSKSPLKFKFSRWPGNEASEFLFPEPKRHTPAEIFRNLHSGSFFKKFN